MATAFSVAEIAAKGARSGELGVFVTDAPWFCGRLFSTGCMGFLRPRTAGTTMRPLL